MIKSELQKIQKEYEAESKKQGISLAIDIVIFTIKNNTLNVLLNKRSNEPHKNKYALPGGFCLKDISLEDNAKQLLKRDIGIDDIYLEQLYTFGDISRDSRGRTVSISYYALLDYNKITIDLSEKFLEYKWISILELESYSLAFDHKKIIEFAQERIQNKIEYTTIAFQLLPKKFTFAQLQKTYEIILDTTLDKRNFRKKIIELNLVEELDETIQEGKMRPAKLFKFKSKKY